MESLLNRQLQNAHMDDPERGFAMFGDAGPLMRETGDSHVSASAATPNRTSLAGKLPSTEVCGNEDECQNLHPKRNALSTTSLVAIQTEQYSC